MFKHRLWNLNGLACGRLTINVGDLDLICLCREWRINVFLCFREFPCVWSPVTYQVTNRDEVKLSSFSRFKTMKNRKMCKHTFVHQSVSISTIQLIFIHPLKTGLYRIHVSENTTSKFGLVVPLVSGSVVSKRSLGTCLLVFMSALVTAFFPV